MNTSQQMGPGHKSVAPVDRDSPFCIRVCDKWDSESHRVVISRVFDNIISNVKTSFLFFSVQVAYCKLRRKLYSSVKKVRIIFCHKF